jgi:hypothetical protein
MTQIIGDHGLLCIDDSDYAAYALAMQCNAQATDAALSSASQALTGYTDRPWISVTKTTSTTVDSDDGSGTIGPDGVIGEDIGTRAVGTGGTVRNRFPAGENVPAGVWLVGSTINWTFGALTADSYRQLMVFNVPLIAGVGSLSNANQIFRMREYQGEAGATGALTTVGVMDNRDGSAHSFVSFISHANLASDMTVAANNWRLWATYLGSGLVF